MAVDSSGNVYIGDSNNVRILKETLSAGSYTQSVVIDDTTFNWLDGAEGIAVDSSGNVYIANASTSGFDANTVVKATLSGGSYHMGVLGASLPSQPWGVAVDSSGSVYVTGGFYYVTKLSYPATSFGTVNVGTTSSVLTFPFTKGTDINTASAGAALSMGAAGEFVDTGTGTCDTNGVHTYTAGTGCTVNVTFTPKYAGIRNGVVEFVNSSGVVVAEEDITGTGTGPQVAFAPGTQSTIGTSLSAPTGVAVDGKGNVYIADAGSNNEYFVETPSGNSYTQAVVGFNQSGLTHVSGIAVDGAANLYYGYFSAGSYSVGQALPIVPTGYNGNIVASTGLGSGLSSVTAVAVDGGGNVYIADTGNNRVIEELYFSGTTYNQPVSWQIVVAGTGLSGPAGVAVDSSGDVYIADTGNNRVLRETPAAGGTFTQSVVVSTGLSGPTGLAVDDIGNLYISDTGNKRVLKETVSGSSYTQSVVLSTGLGSPQGLALDASGNIYIADATNKDVVKLNLATAPTLSFASTVVGSTSSDSPQTVTLENIGTAALTLPIPGTGSDPNLSGTSFSLTSTGSTACPLVTTSSSAGSLAANTTCILPISFTPATTGSLTGSLVLTDNNLNVAASTQTITLGGTGTPLSAPGASLSVTTMPFPNTAVGSTATAISTILTNTGSATLNISGITITGTNPTDFAISANTCGATLPAVTSNTCTISVTFTPASATSFSASLSVADNATGSPQTATLTGTGTAPGASLSVTTMPFPNTTVAATATAISTILTNTGNATLNISGITITGTNPSDFAISANTCGSTLTALATCSISVTFTPASATSFSASLSVADNATGSPQTVTLTGTGTPLLAPGASLSVTTMPFPNTVVGSTATAISTILTNTGTATLTITGVTITGTNPTDFAISANTCGSTLTALATCTISVTFTPASTTSFSATLNVADNATGSPQTATLTGTGTNATSADFTITVTTPLQSINPGGTRAVHHQCRFDQRHVLQRGDILGNRPADGRNGHL